MLDISFHQLITPLNFITLYSCVTVLSSPDQPVEGVNSLGTVSGSLIGGIAIGAVITVIIYKIIFGVPNRDIFNKRKEKRTNKK